MWGCAGDRLVRAAGHTCVIDGVIPGALTPLGRGIWMA